MLKNISIVLVEPSGDENVGMVARAVKNCAITDLRLVNPAPYKTRAAYKWACNAEDILKKTKVYADLKDAIKDASLVVGLSRREGKLRPPAATFDKAISKIYGRAKKGQVALVFGREDDGLERSELTQCDIVVSIPTSRFHPSLNLAQAVMLVCHEMYKKHEARPFDSAPRQSSGQAQGRNKKQEKEERFMSRKEMTPVFKAMRSALMRLGYDDEDEGELREKIIKRFSELFGRGGVRREDVNMFLGLTACIRERVKK